MSGPSTEDGLLPAEAVAKGGDCWNVIGIAGDRSCPELQTHIHCRNCPVFTSAARTFFDRLAPEGYLAEWTRWLGGTSDLARGDAGAEDRDRVSVLIFRLGQEWLAFRTSTIAEVALPRPVHRIPHRTNEILIGLVNLRGQLQLCISLHGLLGVGTSPAAESPTPSQAGPGASAAAVDPQATPAGDGGSAVTPGSRLVVLRDRERSEVWIFPAEEVLGVHRLPRAQILSVSSSLANPDVSFSQAVLDWRDRNVSFLDEQRVFNALRSIGQ